LSVALLKFVDTAFSPTLIVVYLNMNSGSFSKLCGSIKNAVLGLASYIASNSDAFCFCSLVSRSLYKSLSLLTNSHIVDIKGDISIEYSNGKKSKAKLISNEIVSDVAILKVDEIDALALPFGETLNIKTTDDLYAVGYAINLKGEASITKGILSARRSMAGIEYLQTDAAINSGFSGGPLLNSKGEVIGMNSLANENATIGMSLSIETLENIMHKLINNQKVNYLETDRPQNALSSVLKETGYELDDIYNEWQYFHKGEEKPEPPKEEEKATQRQLSAVSELKYLGVKGYDIGWGEDSDSKKFQLF